MHRQPGSRRLLHPARPQRPRRPRLRSRPLRLARHPRLALPRAVGEDRARRPGRRRLVVGRSPPGPAARARHRADRRPRPSRQRPAPHEPALSAFRRGARRVRRRRRRALSVDRAVDAGQRAADHRPLQRALRRLVPACARRCLLRHRAAQPVPGDRAVDGGDPPRQPGGAPGPDRRPQPHLRHGADERRGRVLQRAALAGLGPALRPRRSRASALAVPDRERRRPGRRALVRRPPLPARRHRRQLLRDQRALGRPPRRPLSRTVRAAAGPAPSSSTSNRCACWRRRRRRIGSLLQETWQRYGIPIAVTEAHIDAATRRPDALAARDLARRAGRTRCRRRRARGHRVVAARLVRLELPARRVPRLLRAGSVRRSRAKAAADCSWRR